MFAAKARGARHGVLGCAYRPYAFASRPNSVGMVPVKELSSNLLARRGSARRGAAMAPVSGRTCRTLRAKSTVRRASHARHAQQVHARELAEVRRHRAGERVALEGAARWEGCRAGRKSNGMRAGCDGSAADWCAAAGKARGGGAQVFVQARQRAQLGRDGADQVVVLEAPARARARAPAVGTGSVRVRSRHHAWHASPTRCELHARTEIRAPTSCRARSGRCPSGRCRAECCGASARAR